ncbi:MAG: GNAT family N-acetyltransferase [Planctomycetales bacterium]
MSLGVPEFETARLWMRGWRDEDREPFARMNADPHVMEHFPSLVSREESDAMIERIGQRFAEQGFGLWALERKDNGEFIGFTGLNVPRFEEWFTPCVEIGWRLAFEAWGQGFASEAARRALAYGFEAVHLEKIVSFTSIPNVRSQRVMQRIGMRHEPAWVFEHPSVSEGSPLRTHLLYEIRREQFDPET